MGAADSLEAGFWAFTLCLRSAWLMLSRWGRGAASSLGDRPRARTHAHVQRVQESCLVGFSAHQYSFTPSHTQDGASKRPKQRRTRATGSAVRQLEGDFES